MTVLKSSIHMQPTQTVRHSVF